MVRKKPPFCQGGWRWGRGERTGSARPKSLVVCPQEKSPGSVTCKVVLTKEASPPPFPEQLPPLADKWELLEPSQVLE